MLSQRVYNLLHVYTTTSVAKSSRYRIYIDGANMFYVQRDLGWRIDWQKLKMLLSQYYDIVELRYYTGVKADHDPMLQFLRFLQHIGFITVTKPVKKITLDSTHPEYVQGGDNIRLKANLDVEITADVIRNAPNAEYVVLLSGDSDFACLAEILKPKGNKIVVLSSKRHLSYELKLACHQHELFENLENMLRKA